MDARKVAAAPTPPAERPALSRAAIARHLASLVVAALALLLFAWLAPRVSFGPFTPVLGGLLAYVCVVSEMLAVVACTPCYSKRALVQVVGFGLAMIALVFLPEAAPNIVTAMLVTAVALGLGTTIGGVIGGAIEHPGHLVVVAAVSALVDAFSVMHPEGPTAQLIEVEAAVSVLLLPWPVLGTNDIIPVLGIGDIAFAALYTVGARRHGLPVGRTVFAIAVGLFVTMGIVIISATGIPALPFIGFFVVLVHPKARAIPKVDEKKALVGVLGLTALFGALFVLRQGW